MKKLRVIVPFQGDERRKLWNNRINKLIEKIYKRPAPKSSKIFLATQLWLVWKRFMCEDRNIVDWLISLAMVSIGNQPTLTIAGGRSVIDWFIIIFRFPSEWKRTNSEDVSSFWFSIFETKICVRSENVHFSQNHRRMIVHRCQDES